MIMVMVINDYFVYQYDHGVQKELGAQAKNFIISQPLCAPLVDVLDTVELGVHLPDYLDLKSRNSAAHVLIAVIVAVHYAVKQGDKSSVKKLLDSLTPEQQLQFLSTKDKKDVDGKTAVQWAPATGRKDIEKMLKQYKRGADFEVNYGKLALFPL